MRQDQALDPTPNPISRLLKVFLIYWSICIVWTTHWLPQSLFSMPVIAVFVWLVFWQSHWWGFMGVASGILRRQGLTTNCLVLWFFPSFLPTLPQWSMNPKWISCIVDLCAGTSYCKKWLWIWKWTGRRMWVNLKKAGVMTLLPWCYYHIYSLKNKIIEKSNTLKKMPIMLSWYTISLWILFHSCLQ